MCLSQMEEMNVLTGVQSIEKVYRSKILSKMPEINSVSSVLDGN